MSKYNERIMFLLTPTLKELAIEAAEKKQMKLSEFLRYAIRSEIKRMARREREAS